MRFSPSTLALWMACPLQAKFAKIMKLERRQNASATFGSVVHKALEGYNHHCSVDKAIDDFKLWWKQPELLGLAPDYWPKYTNYDTYANRGVEILTAYDEKVRWENRTVIATEHRFLVPCGKHELTGVIDLLELKKAGNGHLTLRVIDYKTNGRKPPLAALRLNLQFCADTETEILTRRGWKRFDTLLVGEDVLTLNAETNTAEWQPVESVHRFPAIEQTLVSFEGKAHSSLTTQNHRWPVEHTVCGQKGWRREKRIVMSDRLGAGDRILCAAPVVNLPVVPKYDDAFVELVAWYWTEGEFRAGGQGGLSQSERINPTYVARIRSALTATYGPSSVSTRTGGLRAAWRESEEPDCVRFHLNKLAAAELRAVCEGPDKVVLPSFIESLTLAQLRLFIDTSIDADGSTRDGCRVISQSQKERLDVFQMACSLAGIRTVLRNRPVGGSGKYVGREQWILSLKEREPYYRPRNPTEVVYTGEVWCPKTANGTWFARRNGTVYFTGNTVYMYAVEQPEFWLGNGPDFPAIPDGADWMAKLKKVPHKAVWYHLMTNQELNAGERTDGDYLRMYRLLTEVENAVNAEVFVPNISGDTCIYCDFTSQCGIDIPEHYDPEEQLI